MKDKNLEVIDEFYENLINIKNYSLNTADAYRTDLLEFLHFIKTEKMAAGLLQIRNERVCKNYISYLSNQELKSSSIHRKLSSLNSFYNYLVKEELVKVNYFQNVEAPKTPKRLPKIIKESEVMMLFDACDLDDKLGYRNYCLLGCLYGCGLRVSEHHHQT